MCARCTTTLAAQSPLTSQAVDAASAEQTLHLPEWPTCKHKEAQGKPVSVYRGHRLSARPNWMFRTQPRHGACSLDCHLRRQHLLKQCLILLALSCKHIICCSLLSNQVQQLLIYILHRGPQCRVLHCNITSTTLVSHSIREQLLQLLGRGTTSSLTLQSPGAASHKPSQAFSTLSSSAEHTVRLSENSKPGQVKSLCA